VRCGRHYNPVVRPGPFILALVCVATMLLAGCAAPANVLVVVVDAANRSPVPGARVTVRPLEFFVPVEPYPTLDPLPESPSRAVTGEDGAARLSVPRGSPVQFVVLARGYPVYRTVVEPDQRDPEEWILRDPTVRRFEEGPHLDVRLESVETQ